jgi:23S rRNA (adenine-N6)-dimethyltransferase
MMYNEEMEGLQHSQNFIRDADLIRKLLKKTDLTEKDTVLDIGAGDGIISKELAKRAKKVISIELDPQRVAHLQSEFQRFSNIELLQQDFFHYNLPEIKYKVFSNPPFDRISEIIRTFLDAKNPPETLYLFMQYEAAERFIGRPKMTQIAAIYNPAFEIKSISQVHRSEFVPIPNVDVLVVEFTKRKKPLIPSPQMPIYQDFIAYMFNQWQPTVLDSLKRVFTHQQRKRIADDLLIEGAKPSELDFRQIYSLFEVFMKYVPIETKKIVEGAYAKLQTQQGTIQKVHRTNV